MLSIVSLPTFLEGARGSSERVLADPSKGGGAVRRRTSEEGINKGGPREGK